VCAVRYQDVLDLVRSSPALRATRVVALNPQSLADIFRDIRRVGEAAGCLERAETYAQGLEARVAAIRARTAGLVAHERPRVATIEWIEPLMMGGNWMPELVELAGGASGLAESGRHSPYITWDELREWDPQVAIVMPCGFDLERTTAEAQTLVNLPDWNKLSAVRAGRVYAVDGSAYFNRSGPRMVESLEILTHLVHPQLFPRPEGLETAWRRLTHGPP
jgi:iron complex transport system substrate-binding protein